MHPILYFTTADNVALARIDPAMLSDQTRLELLADGIDILDSRDAHGDFQDIQLWEGVLFDADNAVIIIDWSYDVRRTDPMPMELVPPTLQALKMADMDLTGTIDTAALPRELSYLNLSSCAFHGPFDTATLPASIANILIFSNQFSGSLNITAFPACLELFNARDNQFTGGLDFSSLPEGMRELWLAENKFTGSIDLSALPASLQYLVISDNALKQDLLVVGTQVHLTYEGGNEFGTVVDTDGQVL